MTLTKTFAAKLIVAFVAISMLATLATPAKAATVDELEALIAQLTAQIAALTGGSTTTSGSVACTFTRSLTDGASGADVTCLQNYLIGAGFSIPAGATGYFGSQTTAAVAAWQAANGVSPAVGYFGPISQAKYAQVGGSTSGGTGSTGSLEGGAGSISDTDLVSKLSNEEVGEGEEDVEVAGLEVEADEGSDLELTAVTLNFDQGTATRDFDKYAEEVTVWFDGDKVASLDADEFDDDNNFQKTVTLDSGVVIDADETGELIVAVSGISNLDSADEGDTWSVDFVSVRFRDAQNAVVTETVTESAVSFSFEAFASASDLEVKVSNGDDDINDARTIQVDDNDDTEGEDILSFEIEIEGESDVTIDDLSVDFVSTGAGVGEIINTAEIVVDGDVIGSETIASSTDTTETVTFDDLGWELSAGDTVEVLVRVDINDLDGGFVAGATLSADVNPDDAAWDVEDEEGDDVDAGDKTGTASSDAHDFYAQGVQINAVSDSTSTKDTNGDTAGGEQGLYTITFEVTAFDGDMYLPLGATISTSSVDTDDAVAYTIEDSNGTALMLNGAGLGSTTAAVSSTADTSGAYYVVDEGQTEEFTLTVTFTPAADGFFRAQLYGVNFNVDGASAADTMQTATPASDFETEFEDLDA